MTMNGRIDLKKAADTLKGARRVLLCTHVQPDGDAIGSLLAANALLTAMGKDTMMICESPVPENLRILQGWEEIRTPEAAEQATFDLACSLDASDLMRIGLAGGPFTACRDTLVIDHHASNTYFGQQNYVDSHVAATGNLVFRLFDALNVRITQESALYLYAAVSTDTGNFSFGQMDEEFFMQMAGLMKAGLDIAAASRVLHLCKQPAFIRLMARALNSLTCHCGGRLCEMRLRTADFDETGASRENGEGIVNHGLNILGVEMCFLATQENEGTRFNLRAVWPHDVSAIALEFGGGGHLLAAGCTIKAPLDQAADMMRARMERELNR